MNTKPKQKKYVHNIYINLNSSKSRIVTTPAYNANNFSIRKMKFFKNSK